MRKPILKANFLQMLNILKITSKPCKTYYIYPNIVVKSLWNALRGRHKYVAMSGNQSDSELSVTGSSPTGSSNFWFQPTVK